MDADEFAEEQRLIAEINRVQAENERLVAEINLGIENINIIMGNISTVHDNVLPLVNHTAGNVEVNRDNINTVLQAIREVAERYFTFKILSTASKNVTQYTDEYYTRFSYYNQLRRIALGFIIGLDTNFVDNEHMRTMVEEAYLKNSAYWLAYAAMAVMLWASDEEEAAKRALDKALFVNQEKAALYFLLVNLRFGRTKEAQNWFMDYSGRVNPADLGEEWQYLLQAYLNGAFGDDPAFQEEIGRSFKRLLAQAEATTVDFNQKFVDKACAFAESYIHRTKESFAYLKAACADYEDLIQILSAAEKNAIVAQSYGELFESEENIEEDVAQRIEDVLYNLVNSYDDDELEVYKKIRYNESVLAAQGDEAAAKRRMIEEFGDGSKKNFADLMIGWAFSDPSASIPLCVKRFSVSSMREWITKGYEKFRENYRRREKTAYTFNVDGCSITCDENDGAIAAEQLSSYYTKNRAKNILSDKFMQIYLIITAAGLLSLIIMGIQLGVGNGFSPTALVIGILLVLIGVLLAWRQLVAVQEQLKEKERLGQQSLRHAIEELGQWRAAFRREDARAEDLKAALALFGTGEEKEKE